MSWNKKISLKSSDGVVLEVEEAVILECTALAEYIKQNNVSNGDGIAIHAVNFETLTKVMEYCRRHAKARKADDGTEIYDEDIDRLDSKFVKVDPLSLFHLIHAAHQLKIKSLMNLACPTFGEIINNNDFDDISQAFAEAVAADKMFRKSTLCSKSIQGSNDRTESSSKGSRRRRKRKA